MEDLVCLTIKENQTLSCSCQPPWTGDRCEVKLGNSHMTVIIHNLKKKLFHFMIILAFLFL